LGSRRRLPAAPVYATRFHEGAVRYHWPDRTWAQSLDTFDSDSIQIRLGTT